MCGTWHDCLIEESEGEVDTPYWTQPVKDDGYEFAAWRMELESGRGASVERDAATRKEE